MFLNCRLSKKNKVCNVGNNCNNTAITVSQRGLIFNTVTAQSNKQTFIDAKSSNTSVKHRFTANDADITLKSFHVKCLSLLSNPVSLHKLWYLGVFRCCEFKSLQLLNQYLISFIRAVSILTSSAAYCHKKHKYYAIKHTNTNFFSCFRIQRS